LARAPEQRRRPPGRATLVFDVENATTVMETEYVEEARERAHQVAIASGTGHVQDNGGKILAVFPQSLSVNYASYPT